MRPRDVVTTWVERFNAGDVGGLTALYAEDAHATEAPMSSTSAQHRQGHRLLQIGTALFLAGLVVGVLVPAFTVPRLGLSTHLLAITQGLFLAVCGLAWPRLRLTPPLARAGTWIAVYGCVAPLAANLLGAIWGAGNTLLPLAAGAARGTPVQEAIIVGGLRSGGAALIVTALLMLWGLRGDGTPARDE